MGRTVSVTGMILTASPIKEYDRRIEILTRERGRISAFAQGARRANSTLSACTIPFTFGEFTLYEGRNSYNVQSAVIQKFFGDIAQDYDMTCYASYFAEMAQHFTRENMEASQELLLLYVTLLAMQSRRIPLPLIRVIYEMRLMMIEGQSLELFECLGCHKMNTRTVYFAAGGLVCEDCAGKEKELEKSYPFVLSKDALHSLQYILTAPLEKLYSFLVTEEVQKELEHFMKAYLGRYLPHQFKAAAFLE
ncbi:MAG: DNA repair protein RecO [Butyribacter sp.]|nr:DNA repair protein RecO [bacterium]MDY3854152.1 DNA repair protein RecO [Butyribacter sp.]